MADLKNEIQVGSIGGLAWRADGTPNPDMVTDAVPRDFAGESRPQEAVRPASAREGLCAEDAGVGGGADVPIVDAPSVASQGCGSIGNTSSPFKGLK